MIYIERSFEDYIKLLNTFIDDEKKRNEYLVQSREVTEKICRDVGIDIKDYRFKSICRVNVLEKKVMSRVMATEGRNPNRFRVPDIVLTYNLLLRFYN